MSPASHPDCRAIGDGGSGYYTYTDYQRTPASGAMPYGRYSYNIERQGNGNVGRVFWGGNLGDYQLVGGSYVDIGGWRYVCVSVAEVYSGYYGYTVYRQLVTPSTGNIYTNGGTAGNGGRGQGYDGSWAYGASGAAGGQNAGAGGAGGQGGGFGASGNTGVAGGYGNYGGNGAAGTAGGLPGYYLHGSANVIFNNFGTVLGLIA